MAPPSPARCGLPPKFIRWRPGQWDAVLRILWPEPRFTALAPPTGFGKSPMYMGGAARSKRRTAALTATKALQDQLEEEFGSMGLVDIRGMGNYRCDYDAFTRLSDTRVDNGPCWYGVPCKLKDRGCRFFDRKAEAVASTLVSTNYDFWLTLPRMDADIGEFEMLILDEAHEAPRKLMDAIAIQVKASSVSYNHLDEFPDEDDHDTWRAWFEAQAGAVRAALQEAVEEARGEATVTLLRAIRRYRRLLRTLVAGTRITDYWVMRRDKEGVTWEPLWPRGWGNLLFRDIPKVVLTSAALNNKTLDILGIPQSERVLIEYESSFDPERRPIYPICTIHMGNKHWPYVRDAWVAELDRIAAHYLPFRGIIHTGSYERMNYYKDHTKFPNLVVTHNKDTAGAIIKKFQKMETPPILASPSAHTGYNFPDDQCRWNVIGKIQFPVTHDDPIMAARVDDDPDYQNYLPAGDLMQAIGRGNRHARDWCHHIIVDAQFRWFHKVAQRHLAPWFKEAYRWTGELPQL